VIAITYRLCPPQGSIESVISLLSFSNPKFGFSDSEVVPLRILPLGDSITWGESSSTGNGYRLDLKNLLNANATLVNYIGTMRSGTMSNPQNEGHPSCVVSEIADFAKASLPEQPNIVLLMAGVNDIVHDKDPINAPYRLALLLDQIFETCSQTLVVVAQLTPVPMRQEQVDEFNKAMTPLIDARIRAGSHIVMVDMWRYVKPDMLHDGLHPNDVGYRNMADGWYWGMEKGRRNKWIRKPLII